MNIYRKSEIPEHLQKWFEPAEIGLEETPDEYVTKLVDVFRGVRKMLRADGVLLLNLGDSYSGSGRGGSIGSSSTLEGSAVSMEETRRARSSIGSQKPAGLHEAARVSGSVGRAWTPPPAGLKQKDLVGIPWTVAFALRADGWWLRSDIIWAKPNPMPESVTDRPTKSHEYVFLRSKSADYFWDADALREPHVGRRVGKSGATAFRGQATLHARGSVDSDDRYYHPNGRNARSVWTISPVPFAGAHFATMPPELARRCIVAGSRIGDTVCDPFAGALTTAVMAHKTGRLFAGSELSADYCEMGRQRLSDAMAQQVLDFDAPPANASVSSSWKQRLFDAVEDGERRAEDGAPAETRRVSGFAVARKGAL